MENLLPVWTDEYKINWYDADTMNHASLISICNFLQESAWRHANHLGFGYRTESNIDQAWVIIRLLLKMERYPVWQDTITIRTWPRGVDGLFALRDFEILDNKGHRLGGASTQWFIIDVETRKPQAALIVQDILPLATHTPALDEEPEKIIVPEPLSFAYSLRTRYSDVDMYRHVNNTRYIEWSLNVFPGEIFREKHIHSFLIEFLAETLLDEEVEIFRSKADNPSFIKGVRMEDDKTLFRARIHWRQH